MKKFLSIIVPEILDTHRTQSEGKSGKYLIGQKIKTIIKQR